MNRAVIALAASGWLAACGGAPPASLAIPSPSPPPVAPVKVAIVSIDGLRPDAAQRLSNLSALTRRGAFTWRAQTVVPSNTLPSHASMLTGYQPARHGITWDDYLPARGVIREPTVFLAARRAGLRAAMVAGKEKFNTFRDTGDIDFFVGGARSDVDVMDQALAQLFAGVDLLFVHLPDVDLSGHASSWMSPTYMETAVRADAALGRLISLLPENTTLIVTADHGGHGTIHGTTDPLDMTIPWIITGPRIRAGHALIGAVSTMDTAATAGFILGLTLPPDVSGRPVLEAFAR